MKLLATLLLLCSTTAVADTDEWKLVDWETAYVDAIDGEEIFAATYVNGSVFHTTIGLTNTGCDPTQSSVTDNFIDNKRFEVFVECEDDIIYLTPTAERAHEYIFNAFWERTSVTICASVNNQNCVTFTGHNYQNSIEALRAINSSM